MAAIAASAVRGHRPAGPAPAGAISRSRQRPISASPRGVRCRGALGAHFSTEQDVASGSHPIGGTRRAVLGIGLLLGISCRPSLADQIPNAPPEGNCIECIGEAQGTLNTCPLSSASCISSQNDDEQHFVPPWMFECPRQEAIEKLVSVGTGGPYQALLLETPYGRSRADVAGYILQGTWNAITGRPPPLDKPSAQTQQGYTPFDGQLVDRHTTEDGSEYVRIVFGLPLGEEDAARVVDAEFIFPVDDDIVLLRAGSRAEPSAGGGTLTLSFTDSPLKLDNNYARQLLGLLRNALRFEIVPVITDFDPRFNNDKQLWFEKLLDPRNEKYKPKE